MDDAFERVRRLAAEGDAAVARPVERHAGFDQRTDRRRAFAGEQQRPILIDQSGAGGDGIGGVALDGVAGAHRGGDAALGQHARAAGRRWRLGEQEHRRRCQRQRAGKAGDAGADDDDAGAPVLDRSYRDMRQAWRWLLAADRQHPLDGAPGAVGDGGVDLDPRLERLERAVDVGRA